MKKRRNSNQDMPERVSAAQVSEKRDDFAEVSADTIESDRAKELTGESYDAEVQTDVDFLPSQTSDVHYVVAPLADTTSAAHKDDETPEEGMIRIGQVNDAAHSVNKFDRFWLKIWASICAAITFIAKGINSVIRLICRREAPLKYVKAFVSVVLVILCIAVVAAPFNITVNKVETLDIYSDGLIAVQSRVGVDPNTNNPIYKWGFADKNGKIKIECKYEDVMQFRHGVAWVKDSTTSQMGGVTVTKKSWYLIGKNGKRVGSNEFDEVTGVPVKQFAAETNLAGVYNGGWGFINSKGKITIPCTYDEVGNFDEQIARVRKGSITYFINKKNKQVGIEYQQARDFSCGLAAVYRNDLWGFIKPNGEELEKPTYNSVSDFKQGYALVRHGSTYGIINTEGKQVVQIGEFVDLKITEFFQMN